MRDPSRPIKLPEIVLWAVVLVGAWVLANGAYKIADDAGWRSVRCPASMSDEDCRALLGRYDDDAH